jgi:hypothetical protein
MILARRRLLRVGMLSPFGLKESPAGFIYKAAYLCLPALKNFL